MERKIGEIFEFGGEWHQCVEGNDCANCVFIDYCKSHTKGERDDTIGLCVSFDRNDRMHVIFKKLEKIGEPYEKRVSDGTFSKFQRYRVYNSVILPKEPYIYCNFIDGTVEIEIKQTKEDMEENKLNLKPFDIQKAREGKPVCTRDGRKARIIYFDRKFIYEGQNYCIVALINDGPYNETVYSYTEDGLCNPNKIHNSDLMMLPEKKEGWVNVYRDCDGANITKDDNIYSSREAAIASAHVIDGNNYVTTTIIRWEE